MTHAETQRRRDFLITQRRKGAKRRVHTAKPLPFSAPATCRGVEVRKRLRRERDIFVPSRLCVSESRRRRPLLRASAPPREPFTSRSAA